jgi:3-oxoacyl-[acyl-carrier-protein] synthase-3
MRFLHTVIESLAADLPAESLSTDAIERRLAPLYQRLRLPAGRILLMTGIRERRLYPPGTLPSDASSAAARKALARSSIPPGKIDLYIHAAVCRDMLEPATASFAHAKIGLPKTTQLFDLSNACLGFLNALVIAAGLVESGQIRAALVSSGENSRPLLDHTLDALLDPAHTRRTIKPLFANLTIGSAAVAAVLCRDDALPPGARRPRLLSATCRADTRHAALCKGDTHGADALAMQTDSEALLDAGLRLASETWRDFLEEARLDPADIARTITHQVGSTHRRKLYETLSLPAEKDHSTFAFLGNTGSVALPVTLADAAGKKLLREDDLVALLGIGSGLNSLMLALRW